jgi:hypothetical protein
MRQTTNPVPSAAVLLDIYKAQVENILPAFNKAYSHRALARLQRAYAEKLAEWDMLEYICEMGKPEVTLRLGTHQVAIQLPDLVETEIYVVLSKHFHEELLNLERRITMAHIDISEEDEEAAPDNDPIAYVPQIVELCKPAASFPTA